MTDDSNGSVPIYVFRVGNTADPDEVEKVVEGLRDVQDCAGLDAEFVVTHDVEPWPKDQFIDFVKTEVIDDD